MSEQSLLQLVPSYLLGELSSVLVLYIMLGVWHQLLESTSIVFYDSLWHRRMIFASATKLNPFRLRALLDKCRLDFQYF